MFANYTDRHSPIPPRPEIDSQFLTTDGQRYLAEAIEAIRFVGLQPSLGLGRGGFAPHNQHVQGETLDPKCVATSLAWLDCGDTVPLKTPGARSALGSYGAKHLAERWGRDVGLHPYVGNGDLICAILWRGILYKRDESRGSPNCSIARKLLKHARDRHLRGYGR